MITKKQKRQQWLSGGQNTPLESVNERKQKPKEEKRKIKGPDHNLLIKMNRHPSFDQADFLYASQILTKNYKRTVKQVKIDSSPLNNKSIEAMQNQRAMKDLAKVFDSLRRQVRKLQKILTTERNRRMKLLEEDEKPLNHDASYGQSSSISQEQSDEDELNSDSEQIPQREGRVSSSKEQKPNRKPNQNEENGFFRKQKKKQGDSDCQEEKAQKTFSQRYDYFAGVYKNQ